MSDGPRAAAQQARPLLQCGRLGALVRRFWISQRRRGRSGVYAFAVCSHCSALVLKSIDERDACHKLASVTCSRNGGMIRRLALRLGTIASFEWG